MVVAHGANVEQHWKWGLWTRVLMLLWPCPRTAAASSTRISTTGMDLESYGSLSHIERPLYVLKTSWPCNNERKVYLDLALERAIKGPIFQRDRAQYIVKGFWFIFKIKFVCSTLPRQRELKTLPSGNRKNFNTFLLYISVKHAGLWFHTYVVIWWQRSMPSTHRDHVNSIERPSQAISSLLMVIATPRQVIWFTEIFPSLPETRSA